MNIEIPAFLVLRLYTTKIYNMIINQFFTETFTLETITSVLTTINPVLQTNSVSLSFEENNIGVRIQGFSDGSGIVKLQGNITESFTFPGNGEMISLSVFTSISTISLINLTDEATIGIIEVYLSSPSGSPIEFREVQGTYKGRISHRKRSFLELSQGLEVVTNPILFCPFDVPASVQDYVQVIGLTFEIQSINSPSDLYGNINHKELELLDLSGS